MPYLGLLAYLGASFLGLRARIGAEVDMDFLGLAAGPETGLGAILGVDEVMNRLSSCSLDIFS